jgi:murein DD-endopeptidase MepM/ murein hydrolase activator NlpD
VGSDWNGLGGNDTDLGDPVHAVATGVVVDATDHGGGWGNVVRVVHECGGDRVESLYAHLDSIDDAARVGAIVTRGQRLGAIGTAGGRYRAHLHFELRDGGLPLGAGYATDRTGYLDPTAYIRDHRPR